MLENRRWLPPTAGALFTPLEKVRDGHGRQRRRNFEERISMFGILWLCKNMLMLCVCRTLWILTLLLLFFLPFPFLSDSKPSYILYPHISPLSFAVCWPYFWYFDHISGILTTFLVYWPYFWYVDHTYGILTMLYHDLPCYTLLYHVIPCYTMSYHVIPCYTMYCWNKQTNKQANKRPPKWSFQGLTCQVHLV